jgi:hypothetical protein
MKESSYSAVEVRCYMATAALLRILGLAGKPDLTPCAEALWALCHTLEPEMVTCPTCGGTLEETKTNGLVSDPGWTLCLSKVVAVELFRPCPICVTGVGDDRKPTGKVARSWGDVLLKSIDCTNDATHTEQLAVKADALQVAGDPLGEWLALLLAGTSCQSCEGLCPSYCSSCHGIKRELGSRMDAIIDRVELETRRSITAGVWYWRKGSVQSDGPLCALYEIPESGGWVVVNLRGTRAVIGHKVFYRRATAEELTKFGLHQPGAA